MTLQWETETQNVSRLGDRGRVVEVLKVNWERKRKAFAVVKPETAFLAVLGIGFLLRIYIFIAGRMMWQDEAMLAVNLATRSGSELLDPLTFTQIAPISWLYLTDCLHALFGNFEYAARLPGFVASCLALWIFSRVCLKLFSGYVAVIVLVLFALNGTLVDYAAQLKPYAFDVLLAVAVLWFTAKAITTGRLTGKDKVSLLVTCVAGAVFTFTAPFVIGGMGGTLLLKYISERKWHEFAWSTLICVSAGGIFLVLGISLYQGQAVDAGFHSGFAQQYFINQYAPFPPKGLGDISWYFWWLMSALELFAGFQSAYIWLVLTATGVLCLAWREPWLACALAFPVLISLTLSIPKIYPVLPRVNLYYIPIFMILIGESIRVLMTTSRRRNLLLGMVLSFALLAGSFWNLRYMSFPNFENANRDISGELNLIAEKYQTGDIVLVARDEVPKFIVYRHAYGLETADWGMSDLGDNCANAFFRAQTKDRRVWFLKSAKAKHSTDIQTGRLIQSEEGLRIAERHVFAPQLDLIELQTPTSSGGPVQPCAMPFKLTGMEMLGGSEPIWPPTSMWKRND